MSEQNPRPSNEEPDDPTLFQPRQLPAAESATVVAGLDRGDPFDEGTIIRPGPSLRRPGTLVPGQRLEPGSAPPPRQSAVQSLGLEAANENPLLRAAAPLLLLLGRLRTSLLRATDSSLVPQIAAAIEACDRELKASEVAVEDVRTVKFILCVTADEVLANLPRGDFDVTQRSGLLTRFFGESDGGRVFLEELDRARENPKAHAYLLELFHACLVLCFQGGHMTLLGGPALLQDLRQDVHERLQQAGPSRSSPLSPRWEGQPLPGQAAHVRIPLWAAASFIGLALFGTFVGLRISLGGRAEAVAAALLDLEPAGPVEIRKESVPPPSPPPPTAAQASRLDHIRKVLEPHVAAGSLGVQATPNLIVVEIAEKALFEPGKATLHQDARPLVMLVAYALDDETGPVKVVGHSDTTSFVSARFASSFELSQERARSVAALLARSLSDPSRVAAEGKGADAPVASNDTPEGRSKNRRIDIVIPRGD
jgi:type VI secretion system protein ImpK